MLGLSQRQRQAQVLAPGQIQGLKMLGMCLPDLRAELVAQIAVNPAIEDIDHPLETPLSAVEAKREEEEVAPDYPEDGDFIPGASLDEAAAERRQAFFDNQVREETLQQHLVAQFPFSDIVEADRELAETLVGDLDANGRYVGSIPDAMMSFGKTEAEVLDVLAKIRELDPPGCGARNPRECLLAQLDKLDGSPCRETVRRLIAEHFEAIATGRFAEVEKALGLTHAQYREALLALRTLEAYPGRPYQNEKDRIEYVNPEVHAIRRDGYWYAVTDRRSLPEIRLSEDFLRQMRAPGLSAAEKAAMRSYVESARALRDFVTDRRNTIENVAQAVFDRQQDFFSEGFKALKPMTEVEVAGELEIDVSTVSRTVRDKYVSTPFGTIELRRFFTSGVKTSSGEAVSQEVVRQKLRELVSGESKSSPLSDQSLTDLLKEAGFPIARRTVAKYREALGIPPAQRRKSV